MHKLIRGMGSGRSSSNLFSTRSGDKVAWFKDPDGNVLSVSQHVD